MIVQFFDLLDKQQQYRRQMKISYTVFSKWAGNLLISEKQKKKKAMPLPFSRS